MNAKQINQTFDLLGYVSRTVGLKKTGKYFVGPCPICGGRDRFNLKKTTSGDLWICRHCKPEKYHSALDFLMMYHNESFTDALKRAGGDVQPEARPRVRQTPKTQIDFPSQDWQVEAWQEVNAANDTLLGIPEGLDTIAYAVQLAKHSDSDIGRAGRKYLTERGIDRAAWLCFNLGYAVAFGRPAIVIPYTDGQTLTAVKYRFIDELAQQDKSKRFAMKLGSKPYVFGLENYNTASKSLVIVEGEINAISLWQVIPPGVTVVSCGGESRYTPMLRAMANQFDKIIIWLDELERAESLRRYLGRPEAMAFGTPRNVDGIDKWDANQMLQAGYLAEFINSKLQDMRVSA